MIDVTIHPDTLESNIAYCREKGITLPTFAMMKNPATVPEKIKDRLQKIGLWDLHSDNLYRITWNNEPVDSGGLFGGVNHIVLPPELTGCKATIIMLTGRWFPTGAHKVGATFGCLAPALVTGQFDPRKTKAVWPSTGNYCRGGAYISALLACNAIAILPEEMSRERFDWLTSIAVDDEIPMRLLRLFNEPLGRHALEEAGVETSLVQQLDLLGISGIGNMIAAVKFAKYSELTENDVVVSIATDSMQLYGSRVNELEQERGVYTGTQVQRDLECIQAVTMDHTKELSYYDRKAIHNLKYYTWIEQQGRDLRELDAQWYDHDNYWYAPFDQVDTIDELITDFNARTGLL